jgi:hypothetical protein
MDCFVPRNDDIRLRTNDEMSGVIYISGIIARVYKKI